MSYGSLVAEPLQTKVRHVKMMQATGMPIVSADARLRRSAGHLGLKNYGGANVVRHRTEKGNNH